MNPTWLSPPVVSQLFSHIGELVQQRSFARPARRLTPAC
jgi:hypothetical protein